MSNNRNQPTAETARVVEPARKGEQAATPADADQVLPLPHERDTSVGHVNPEPRPRIRQAARDLKEGQVDTDMRATPGLDAQQRRKVTASTSSTKRRR